MFGVCAILDRIPLCLDHGIAENIGETYGWKILHNFEMFGL